MRGLKWLSVVLSVGLPGVCLAAESKPDKGPGVSALFVVVFVLIVLSLAARVLSSGVRPTKHGLPFRELPFRKKDWLFTKAERSFYGVLKQAVDGEFEVFAKVRLLDLLWLPKGTTDRQAHMNRVVSKHVDFVLCEPTAVAPALAIELDDSSHRAAQRRRRDAVVEDILGAAGLPLLRVPVRAGYNPATLRDVIARRIGGTA